MKVRNNALRFGVVGMVVAALACVLGLSACGGSSPYADYAAAYNKVSAGGGIDADITLEATMDGTTETHEGTFRVDNTNNMLYYEMTSDGEKTTQFSDGEYLYTERGTNKTKYSLSGSQPSATPSKNGDGTQPDQEAPEFDTDEFMNEFGSILDAGKIRDLGLLEPLAESVVTNITKDGSTYNIEVADSVVQTFVNAMVREQSGSDTVEVSNLTNFKYSATESNGVITSVTYSGDVTVKVDGSLMSDGNDAEYSLTFKITINFQNPGEAVVVTLPDDADSYTEVSNF